METEQLLASFSPERPFVRSEVSSEQVDFFEYPADEVASILAERAGLEAYRARQIFRWVYRHGVTDLEQMTDISRKFRGGLGEWLKFPKAEVAECQLSSDGTRKYLIRTTGGALVESVMIKQPTRFTLCVSSQVGCGMGCQFCRTATMGFRRNLSTSEIVQQVFAVAEDSRKRGDSFNNIVFMGMGEPLHNLNSVVRALSILVDSDGFAIPPRKITVSTVGLVPAIKKFGELTSVNLAVSLNATTDEIRSQIMPVNRRFSLDKLLETLLSYPVRGKKRITIEYVMLSGVNDSEHDLRRLPRLLHGIKAKVNLIPYNENAGLGYKAPKREWVHHWYRELSNRLDVTIRWSKGADIKAACGQLATSNRSSEG